MKDLFNTKKFKAFSLVEMVLSIGLASIVVIGVVTFSMEALRYNNNKWERINAGIKIKEIGDSLEALKNDSWQSILNIPLNETRYLSVANNRLVINNGVQTINGITNSFMLQEVYRDDSLNITTSGGTLDYGTRKAVVTISWTDTFGNVNNLSNNIFLTNWNTSNISETATADFNDGTNNGTFVDATIGDGGVSLQSAVYADWCNPSITSTSYDMPGQGVARSIVAEEGLVAMGTGDNASGLAFLKETVSNTYPPTVTSIGTFDGYKTNGIYSDSNYAYLATDDNQKELVILNISSAPFTEIGNVNVSGSADGKSVVVRGNYGYMTISTADRFYVFDLTSKTGERTILHTINLAGVGNSIFIRGNYAYVAITGSTTTELQIIDISNPSTASIVGQANVDSAGAVSIYVNEAETRAYLAAAQSSTQRELFILDVSTKTGNRTLISSYDTSGMNPTFVTFTPDNTNRVIIGGVGGEEYQVVNAIIETSLTRCGGANIDSGIYGGALVKEVDSDAYSYIVTGDSSSELRIIRGGEGGGDANGNGFLTSGDYTSNIFDVNTNKVNYYLIKWGETVPTNTNLQLQIRAGNFADLSDASWVGSDGTASTFFTNNAGEVLPSILQGKRYIQYKAFFTSGKLYTPRLEDITINYGK